MLFLLAPALSSASIAQPPIPAPEPPIIRLSGGDARPSLLVMRPGEARCDGVAVRPVLAEPPNPTEIGYVPPTWPASPPSLRLAFRIDAEGRPLSISDDAQGQPGLMQARDVVPAFSVWRFAPGTERRDCEIVFTATVEPIATLDLPMLHRYAVLGGPSASFRQALGARLTPAGSTCFQPSPEVRRRVYPPFSDLPQPPGTAAYALVGYDIDAAGQPINVRLLDSSGNARLATESVTAVRESRFQPGARTGCTYPYWRRAQETVVAPPPPGANAFRTEAAVCPPVNTEWAQAPRLVFPAEFERRRVEGWAILRYDVAPWGEVGNVEVLAAEPSARFGTHGANILRSARRPAGPGATGCTIRVRFELPGPGEREQSALED